MRGFFLHHQRGSANNETTLSIFSTSQTLFISCCICVPLNLWLSFFVLHFLSSSNLPCLKVKLDVLAACLCPFDHENFLNLKESASTRKRFLGARACFLGSRERFLGVLEPFLYTRKHFLGAWECFLGARERFLGAIECFLGFFGVFHGYEREFPVCQGGFPGGHKAFPRCQGVFTRSSPFFYSLF